MVKFLVLTLGVLLSVLIENIESVCQDKVNTCSRASPYCKWPSLVNTLQENCQLTCGYCTPSNDNTAYKAPPRNNPSKKQKANEKIPNYVLHYFAFRFRAEPARMIFHYKGIKFTDNQIAPQDYPSVKNMYPNGQVPVLSIDNRQLSQSNAIYRYLARKFGLLGKSDMEMAYLDQISELFREMIDATTPYVQVKIGFLKGANEDELHTKFINAIDKYAPQMEKFLSRSKSGFFVSSVSWVDFYVADTMLTMNNFEPAVVSKYAKLLAHQKKIYGLPQLRKYIQSRPVTKV